MEERVRCPRCWKRVPQTARFCRRCGYALTRVGPPVCKSGAGVPLLLSGLALTAGILATGWLAASGPVQSVTPAPPPAPAPYVIWGTPRHHRVTLPPPPPPVRPWIQPDGVVVSPPPQYRTRYVTPPRQPTNPYLYNRPANPYVYPPPDANDPQR